MQVRTTWLVENIDVLSEALDLPLQDAKREQACGERMKKTLLAAAALVVALTGAANALELTGSKTHDAVLAELSKKYPKIDDVVFFDDDKEVIFYTPEWHMSCKYTVKPKVTIGKCRVIHA